MARKNFPLDPRPILGLLVSCLLAAVPSSGEESFELRPGLVVDPVEGVAYLMQPSGVLEAVDLGRGSTLWTSREVARPLAARDGRLLAQVDRRTPGALALGILDTSSGRTLLEREIELPPEVIPGIVDGMGASFSARAENDAETLRVSWTFSRQRVGAIPDEMRPAASASAERSMGAVRLDPRTGATEKVVLASVEAPDPSILLADGERFDDVEGRQFRSVDGRHVLASRSVADGRTWLRYEWTILNAVDGETLGSLNVSRSYAPFAVVGGLLLYEASEATRRVEGEVVTEPLRLIAVSLPGGVVQWSRELRDTAYRGPFPP